MTEPRILADDFVAAARGELNVLERSRFEAALARSPTDAEAFRAVARGLTAAQVSRDAPSPAALEALIARLEAQRPRPASTVRVPRFALALALVLAAGGAASAAWYARSGAPAPAAPERPETAPSSPAPALGSPAESDPTADSKPPDSVDREPADREEPVRAPKRPSPAAGTTPRADRSEPDAIAGGGADRESVRTPPSTGAGRRLRDDLQGGLPLWSKLESDLDGLSPGRILALAEDRAREGHRGQAAAIYRKAIRDPTLAPHRDAFRYGLARLWMTSEPERADALLARVARGRDAGLAAEADLARCELRLSDGGCAAYTCLVGVQVRRPSLGEDVSRLVERWGLASCAPREPPP